jgi:hypothetical protein
MLGNERTDQWCRGPLSRTKKTCCRLEDLDGFLELTILAFELFVLPGDIGGHSVTLTGVDLGLVGPPSQRFVGHSQPLGHRGDAGRAGVVLLGMVGDQPHRPGLELVVVLPRHDANNLPRKKVCIKPGVVHDTPGRINRQCAPAVGPRFDGNEVALAQNSECFVDDHGAQGGGESLRVLIRGARDKLGWHVRRAGGRRVGWKFTRTGSR